MRTSNLFSIRSSRLEIWASKRSWFFLASVIDDIDTKWLKIKTITHAIVEQAVKIQASHCSTFIGFVILDLFSDFECEYLTAGSVEHDYLLPTSGKSIKNLLKIVVTKTTVLTKYGVRAKDLFIILTSFDWAVGEVASPWGYIDAGTCRYGGTSRDEEKPDKGGRPKTETTKRCNPIGFHSHGHFLSGLKSLSIADVSFVAWAAVIALAISASCFLIWARRTPSANHSRARRRDGIDAMRLKRVAIWELGRRRGCGTTG